MELRVNLFPHCATYWKLDDDGNCIPTPYYYKSFCEASYGEIFIDLRLLRAYEMDWMIKLNDGSSCDATRTEHATITRNILDEPATGDKYSFPYESCDSEISETDDMITFSNFFTLYLDAVDGIFTRVSYKIPVVCQIPKEVSVDSGLFYAPDELTLGGAEEIEDSAVHFSMELFESDAFDVVRTNKNFVISRPIYFQITGTMPDINSNLKFYVNQCSVKQNSNEFDFINSVSFATALKNYQLYR